MENKLFSNSDDLHPGDFPPGSIESRAAARAAMSDPGKPPNFVVQFVDTGDEKPIVLESRTAVVNGKTLTLEPGESQEDFKARVSLELPAFGGGVATMFADADESTSATEDPGTVGAAKVAPRIST